MPAGTGRHRSAHGSTDAPSADLASLKWYTVKRGDTLPAIARKLHVSKADLAEANYLSVDGAACTTGQKLIVPHEATVLMAARTERPRPGDRGARRRSREAGAARRAGETSNRVKTVYQVKRGDTLASIARLFKTTVASLRTWNPRLPGSRLWPAHGSPSTVRRTKPTSHRHGRPDASLERDVPAANACAPARVSWQIRDLSVAASPPSR